MRQCNLKKNVFFDKCILSDMRLDWKIDSFYYSRNKDASARHGVIKVVDFFKI